MSDRLKHVLLVLFLCILPVQSMAFTLLPLQCTPAHAHRAVSSAEHDRATHAHAALHEEGAPLAQADGHGHFCCHQFSTATLALAVSFPPSDFRIYASTVSLLTPLHIPELPQRPPKA